MPVPMEPLEPVFWNIPTATLLTASVALIGAVVAAVSALITAGVNGWNARRLAEESAHREFRSRQVAEIQASNRTIGHRFARFHVLDFNNAANHGLVREFCRDAVLPLTEAMNEVESLYTEDDVLAEALIARLNVIQSFVACAFDADTDANRARLVEHMRLVNHACIAVSVAAEAYVYGRRSSKRSAASHLASVRRRFTELDGATRASAIPT